jgi:hypothetical protein
MKTFFRPYTGEEIVRREQENPLDPSASHQ